MLTKCQTFSEVSSFVALLDCLVRQNKRVYRKQTDYFKLVVLKLTITLLILCFAREVIYRYQEDSLL